MAEMRFTNERGNRIRIEVHRTRDMVHLEIEGPKSISTNDITVMEARHVRSLLARVLTWGG